ncbi:hypothetical protein ACFQYP_12895 [Nonomuraea antimicrobica]
MGSATVAALRASGVGVVTVDLVPAEAGDRVVVGDVAAPATWAAVLEASRSSAARRRSSS